MKRRSVAVAAIIAALATAILAVAFRSDVQPAPDRVSLQSAQRSSLAVQGHASEARPAGTTPSKAVAAITGKTDWSTAYQRRQDALDFITGAAKSALHGDGEAAYFVARSIERCYGRERDVWNAPDPEAAFASKWARYPDEHFAMANDRNAMEDCLRYVREDAFAGLPDAGSSYRDPGFWHDLAYKDGNPKALARHTQTALSALPDARSDRDTPILDQAETDIQKIMSSGDTAAMFDLGLVFDAPDIRTSGFQGLEIRLAACEMGFDCTTNNPALRETLGCFGTDTCAGINEFQDILRRDLPPAIYAAIDARAQALADAVRRGDTATLQQLVRIRR
jgi:hypothetical protein